MHHVLTFILQHRMSCNVVGQTENRSRRFQEMITVTAQGGNVQVRDGSAAQHRAGGGLGNASGAADAGGAWRASGETRRCYEIKSS